VREDLQGQTSINDLTDEPIRRIGATVLGDVFAERQ
jgi:hypothetical protein